MKFVILDVYPEKKHRLIDEPQVPQRHNGETWNGGRQRMTLVVSSAAPSSA